MNKSYVLLCICEDLKNGVKVNTEECIAKYKISMPTFRRYIALLRSFFIEQLGMELKYSNEYKSYRVEKI